MYISISTNTEGDVISSTPRIILPTPTSGNVGLPFEIILPSTSVIMYSDVFLRALRYANVENTPERRNKMPIASVIHVTVLSGKRNKSTQIIMEQIALKNELCTIFMSLMFYFSAKLIKNIGIAIFFCTFVAKKI